MALTEHVTQSALKERITHGLAESRRRTLALTDLPDAELHRQVSPLMSPLVWDLAHIANYEELWLLRAVDGRDPVNASYDDLYNAFEHPRWERPSLPILGPAEARAYARAVRFEALELLEGLDLGADAPELTRHGFVHGMVIQHEHQHCETMLATHQLRGHAASPPPGTSPNPEPGVEVPTGWAEIEVGRVTLGSDDPWVYDNERPAHEVSVAPFRLARHPVTNEQHAAFIDDGGYDREELWTPEGWRWRREEGLVAPQFWRRSASTPLDWEVQRFGTWIPVRPDEPVQHVCAHEADAHARWVGARLPTEIEWEVAATWHPTEGKRPWPWGHGLPTPDHANLGQRHPGPSPIGAHPDGANPWGVHQLVGDVWEWTASTFSPWPGFRSFPYKEYSEVFFPDGYRVLRGGSWAADPSAARGTFRNWDHAIRRQIFSGFRLAADA